ncbi:hypothetical protein OBI92_21580 [Enterobacter hormaechei]|uniref:hypothetical protein n=1 Tax=Enterobacter hormaechei TaxID=158836 RepID=UPI0021F4E60A|nr:hypothetical protein [Enterobacter hormaechei]MCV9905656.1 hypothetical protein [Enterobacter hormaechei]
MKAESRITPRGTGRKLRLAYAERQQQARCQQAGAFICILTSHNLSATEQEFSGVASFIPGIPGAPTTA